MQNKCNYCEKIFSRKYCLDRHLNENRCKKKNAYNEKLDAILNEMASMKKHIEKLEQENSKYKQVNVTNNITSTQNIINFTINPFGEENLSKITDNDYLSIIKRGLFSVPSLIEKVHFDKNTPENHNVYISNLINDYVLVYDGENWKLKNRCDILDKMYDDSADFLEVKFNKLIKNLDEGSIIKFRRFLKARATDDAVEKKIKKELKRLLYENREIVKKSVKMLK